MSITQTDSKPEGRIPTLIGLIKRLVFEDPIIGLLCLVILFPVGYAITSSAITGDIDNLPVLLGVEAAAVVLCLPLIITKTWKNNQRQLMEQKRIAIEAEALKRTTREKHKQGRLDEVMDAKIKLLQAQTTFILDQSDRHEQQLLVASAKELKQKFGTVKDIWAIKTHISVINAELTKVETDYDEVLGAIDRIEAQLGTKTKTPVAIAVKESVAVDETDWRALYKEKLADIESLTEQQGQMQARLTNLATENEQLVKERQNLKDFIAVKEEFPVAFAGSQDEEFVPELTIKTEKLEAKLAVATEEPTPSKAEIKEAIQVVDELEDESPEETPPNFWNCPKCQRANNLKQNRCPVCGSSKPVLTTNV